MAAAESSTIQSNTPGPALAGARWRAAFLFAGALVVGGLLAGCGQPEGTVLGRAPRGEVKNVIAVQAGETAPDVTLRGTMVEKCPTAGCWFYLRDDTGTIKVDTKAAGFVVVDVPLQAEVTVVGKVRTEGDEVSVQAAGLRY